MDARTRDGDGSRRTVRPGALTALLGELALAPDATGWAIPLVPGEVIGRFEIVREIGRGGFGVVYEARDTELGRSVAFKAIRAGCCDEVREQRTLAEAEAAARLAHPNIVHLYDVGRSERGPFLIMELLHGESLHDRLARDPPLKLRDAVGLAVEISRGVAHAHEQGVVHRDLKPGNVFLCDDGQVKVLDFGLAHVFERCGPEGGTPEYMAPEQARGEPSDERADVYALGVILHELVLGFRPGRSGALPLPPRPTFFPLPLRQRGERVRVRGALSKLLTQMLAQDPAERPANASHVHAQLASIQKSQEPKHLLQAAVAVAAAAVLGAGLFAWLWQRPLPPGRLSIALADTSNPTGDADLDGLSAFLGTALEGSRRVSLVARSRLVDTLRARGSAPARLDEAAARAAAVDARARVLVVPAVLSHPGGYEVAVRAFDLERNEQLFSLREGASGKGGVPDALDRLSERVRKALHEEPDERAEPPVLLSNVLPVNPEAWRHYAEGLRLESEASTEASFRRTAEAYQRALAVDPEFPLAHFRLAWLSYRAFWISGMVRDVQPHLDAALKSLHRVPRKERVLVEAWSAWPPEESLRLYDRAIAEWPADPEAYLRAGDAVLRFRGDLAAARPYLEKAIELAPLTEHRVIDFLVILGRHDEALARARRWTEESPGRMSYLNLSSVHRARGEAAEALAAARRALSFDGDLRSQTITLAFADAEAFEELEARHASRGRSWWEWLELRGRRREALAALDADWTSRPTDRQRAEAYHHLRLNLLSSRERSDPTAIWREVEALFRAGSPAIHCTAKELARAGDLERAQVLLDGFGWIDPRARCVRAAEAVIRWKRGEHVEALRKLAMTDLHRFLRAEILADLGRHREAVETLRAWRRYDAETTLYPRSLFLEASALERLGERDEALRTVDRLLRLWERADRDLPMLRDARALRARLLDGGTR